MHRSTNLWVALKIVYFRFMEIKVILYIVVGLFWVFSKFLNARQNKQRELIPTPDFSPEVPRPAVKKRVPLKKITVQATKAPRTAVIPPVSLESEIGLESVTVRAESAERIAAETGFGSLQQVQELDDATIQAITSPGAEIAAEVKNGTIDWRRALVIKELITPRYSNTS